MEKSERDLLASYIDALYPIIYINHFDFKIIDEMLQDIAEDKKILEFQEGLGPVDFETKALMQESDLSSYLHIVKMMGINIHYCLCSKISMMSLKTQKSYPC